MKKRRVLHVPMSDEMYASLRVRAQELGFSSPQGYIRHWATAQLRSPGLSQAEDEALRYLESVLRRTAAPFAKPEIALMYMARHIQCVLEYRSMKSVGLAWAEHQNLDNRGNL